MIAEELAEILGRDPTQAEVQDYIDQLEAALEDNDIQNHMDLANDYSTD